jgi:hypothetical protein
MEYLIGVGLAVAVCVFALVAGWDRERVFYPTMAAPIATYYVLFAVMSGSTPVIVQESLAALLFLVMAAMGFRKNLWLAAAAIGGHGVFDLFHHMVIRNAGVPVWWPGFCLSFDVLAGCFLSVLLIRRSGFALSRGNYDSSGNRKARAAVN